GHLGGGRYAFKSDMHKPRENYAAVFDIDAPSIEVSPTQDVETKREGDEVKVVVGGEEDGNKRSIVVERADAADELFLPEKVMQNYVLRNSLSFFEEGVERVVLETTGELPRYAYVEVRDASFEFQGEKYEVTVKN
ncbi:MAG: hypothetical protein SXQ77_09690, partial [Halobacteria archaeon]|nr:hypothetical protein [Halobacteria archaeon]